MFGVFVLGPCLVYSSAVLHSVLQSISILSIDTLFHKRGSNTANSLALSREEI